MSPPIDAFSSLLLLLLPPTTSASAAISILLVVLTAAALLHPGGIAWFLARRRTHIPGPGGLAAGLALSGEAAHRALAEFSRSLSAGRLMSFSVGLTRFVVSSHPDTAKEILNSSAFADRPIKESARELLFHRAMGFAPFGEYWRNLRRISATHLFCPRRIAAFSPCRREIGERMVEEVRDLMVKNRAVEVKRVFHFGSLNNVMMSVFGRGFDFGKDEGKELEEMVREGYELLGVLNWSDHLPLLGWMDLQGVRRRSRVLVEKVNVFVGRIIEEHRIKRRASGVGEEKGRVGDFVDVLLDLEKEEKLTDSDMVAVLWMIFRGTDTVAILLEWIMARMVLHPDIQAKAQSEIDAFVGKSRPVSDADIPNLHFLQCIVKESLRMHPPGPLLSWARLAIHDVHVGNHFIPAGTTAMVNMWAITHDESIWVGAEEFKPERFTADDLNIMGADLRLAPFGSGRRVCPGKAMGLSTVLLWLAQLLQSFRWMPSSSGVDLSECLKMSLEMKNPLVCCAIPRD
ncbi:Cytochrome P450 78A4 [Apostasia shenzhenica]|uniref:Cytochrome P450 78A4 n=1 Tax=Apostasia shenzhenica TaxID=1088818 RepID=A0A2I0A2G0_9ASPA|nr:Cytochrome P450 78A4 [Apostasia shenzhenica]